MKSSTVSFAKDVYSLLGARLVKLVALSSFMAVLLSVSELLFSLAIQLLLQVLGLMGSNLSLLGIEFDYDLSVQQICLLLLLIGFVRSASYFLMMQLNFFAFESVHAKLRLAFIHSMFSSHDNSTMPSIGESTVFLSEVFPKTATAFNAFFLGLSQLIQVILLLLFLLLTGFIPALISIGLILTATLLVRPLTQQIARKSHSLPLKQGNLLSSLVRSCKNYLLVKVYNTESQEIRRMTESSLDYSGMVISMQFVRNLLSGFTPMLGILLICLFLLFPQTAQGIEGAIFVSFIYLLIRMVTTLRSLTTSMSAIVTNWGSLSRAIAFFGSMRSNWQKSTSNAELLRVSGKHRDLQTTNSIHSSGAANASTHPPEIRIERLCFSYIDNQPLFDAFSYTLTPGSHIGISGPSGCGKSTLLALILGLIRPQSGSVTVEGQDAHAFFANNHALVGYVGPEPLLFAGTLRENLTYGLSAPVSDQQIHDGLQQAGLKDLSLELDHKFSENVENLSSGQKQRIGIARALIRKPSILVLDEATSNLDLATEEGIANSIASLKGKTTVILVSHRESFLSFVDDQINLGATD